MKNFKNLKINFLFLGIRKNSFLIIKSIVKIRKNSFFILKKFRKNIFNFSILAKYDINFNFFYFQRIFSRILYW